MKNLKIGLKIIIFICYVAKPTLLLFQIINNY